MGKKKKKLGQGFIYMWDPRKIDFLEVLSRFIIFLSSFLLQSDPTILLKAVTVKCNTLNSQAVLWYCFSFYLLLRNFLSLLPHLSSEVKCLMKLTGDLQA